LTGRRACRLGPRAISWLAMVGLVAAPVHASDAPAPKPPSLLDELVRDVRARIDAAIVARPPVLVPPKKLDVRYKIAKLGSLDLGAPLVALTAADLDGDRKGELYAVTAREVIAIGVRGKKLEELGRVAFGGEPALPMPRDVVGSAIVDAGAIVASVSTWTRSMRVTWKGKTLTGTQGEPGFVLCPGVVEKLAPGRNYFGDAATGHYGVRCRSGLVEPDGRALRARAQLSLASKLEVQLERCAAQNLGCQPAAKHELAGVGVAFEIADVDRDGKPEAIYAAAVAPGDPDTLKIVTLGDDDKKQAKLKKTFAAGGVAGLTLVDVDGNGSDDVIAAVRLVGATRVDVWRVE
jgi:hypothetical protein